MLQNIFILLILLASTSSFTTKAPFLSLSSSHRPIFNKHQSLLFQTNNNDDNNDKSITEKIDNLLDKQFFDPDEIIQAQGEKENGENGNGNNPLLWFANLVKNDYETAEALYAAAFISILVIFTQESLRIVKYGDAYVPFTKIGSGTLF